MVMKSSAVTSPAKSEELKYKGVRKRKWGKWVTEIRQPHSRERIWLGSYDSPEKAARAFDAAQICLRGLSAANLNFPDNPPELDVVPGLCPAQIQLIASKFANTPPPPPTPESSLSLSDANESSFDDGPALFTFDDYCSGFGLPEFYTYHYDDQWNDTASDDLWLWNF